MASIRYHFDEHVPNGAAGALHRHGVDAETSSEAGLLGATDHAHLAHAYRQRRMIVTHDRDYLRLHAEGVAHSGIAFCTHDAQSPGYIGHLVEALLLLYAIYDAEEMVGRLEYI